MDDLRNRLLGPRQARAAGLAEKLARVEAELRQRDLATLSTQGVFTLSRALRQEIERETGGLPFAIPVKEISNEEYIEQIQEWTP